MEIGGTESIFYLMELGGKGEKVKNIIEKYKKETGREITKAVVKVYLNRLFQKELIERVGHGTYRRIEKEWARKGPAGGVKLPQYYADALSRLGGSGETRQIWKMLREMGRNPCLDALAKSLNEWAERGKLGREEFIDRYYIV